MQITKDFSRLVVFRHLPAGYFLNKGWNQYWNCCTFISLILDHFIQAITLNFKVWRCNSTSPLQGSTPLRLYLKLHLFHSILHILFSQQYSYHVSLSLISHSVRDINNLCFVLTFIITLKYLKCDTSTFIYTNRFNQ